LCSVSLLFMFFYCFIGMVGGGDIEIHKIFI